MEYVAGLIDGEGSFSIMAGKPQKAKFYVLPVVQMSMLHHETVLEAASILNRNGVGSYIHLHKQRGSLSLSVKGYKRCLSLIKALDPYLLTKRDQAAIMEEFINSRLSRKQGSLPTAHEIGLMQKIRDSNSHQNLPRNSLDWLYEIALKEPSETIRSAA